MQADLLCSRDELKGDFFRATHGSKGQKFTKLSLGKNTIGKVGVQVATELCLARPEIYTGHCWRQSCGTSASDSGVNVTTLMAMMGWSYPKTAIIYVKKSRMTSLSLSLYLTNVQRQNCSNPFPNSPLEKRQAVKKIKGTSSIAAKCSNTLASPCNGVVSSDLNALKVEEVEGGSGSVELSATAELNCSFQSEEIEEIDFDQDFHEKEAEEESKEKASGFDQRVEDGSSLNPSGQSVSASLGSIDSQLTGFLHNLQNSGNIAINFHFDGNQK